MKYLINKKMIPFMFLLDVVGNILFFWTKLRKTPKNKKDKMKKVLFIRLEHIGDMIMATPVFENFKKAHPDCEVHVLCRKLTKPLIENNPYVDKIIEFEAPWFIRADKNSKNKKFSELVKELKKEKYDVVFEMHGDPRNNRIAFKTGAYSVGYSCRGFGFLLNKIKKYDAKKHIIDQNISLIEDFIQTSKNKITKQTKIFTDKKSQSNCAKLMKKYKLSNKKFIIINPKSGRTEKDLTDDEVMKFINKNKTSKIIIMGSEAEHNKRFSHLANAIDLTGQVDLLTLTDLVKKAKKVYAPDTGIVHIAHAVGTSCKAVYKTTDKKIWGYN